MNFLRALGRFFGPYMAFAVLSGLSAGFVCGALITLTGFLIGLGTLVIGAIQSSIGSAVVGIVQAFPSYALVVLFSVALGFAGGFSTALIAAPLGAPAGTWWSFIVTISALSLVYPFYASHGPHGPGMPPYPMALGAFGTLFAFALLGNNSSPVPWIETFRCYLRESWLPNPPQSTRIAGILLPILLYAAWEIKTVWPEFVKHPNYAARIGKWATWQSSKRMVMPLRGIPGARSHCQSNLKQISLGLQMYLSDSNETYPPIPQTSQAAGKAIFDYVKSDMAFQCPQELYFSREANFSSGDFTDYWFNARFYGLNVATVKFPSNSILLGEGNTGAGEANAAYSLRNLPLNWAPSLRHLGGANYAFADGHVKWLKPRAISNSATPNGGALTMVP